jgi:hypothetical protein
MPRKKRRTRKVEQPEIPEPGVVDYTPRWPDGTEGSLAEVILAAETPMLPRQPKPLTDEEVKAAEARAAARAAKQRAVEAGRTKTQVELHKLSTDGDLVDIWERRLLNPDHREANPIRIKTPGMEIRWINLLNRGRFQRARYEQGWVPIHKAELVDEREISGVSFTVEGWVCRGERQSEMLMKMPKAVFRKIQERRAQLNTQSYKKLRQNMGSAGSEYIKNKYGGSSGDQAAEAASHFVGDVKFGTETASTDELFED